MKKVTDIFYDLSYSEVKALWAKHLLWSKENNRISGNPKWFDEPGTVNVIGVRCNTEVDFNFGKYNDYLILIVNNADGTYSQLIIDVTVDPAKTKHGIAHLRQGVWNSYELRPHKWTSRYFNYIQKTIKRWALCQDLNNVEIVRTDGKGKIIETERGKFGINIHDNGGYADSSLGCTVLEHDKEYFEKYLAYLYDWKNEKVIMANPHNVSYCLMNFGSLEKYINEVVIRVERAKAVNGTAGDTSGMGMGATKEGVSK